jgi:RNA recognition motif-containing protein
MKIYVGNLSYDLSENDLKDVFTPYGEVASVKIMTDKFTGRSKGFAFVEMPNDAEANNAINGLNDVEVAQRSIKVNEARERTFDNNRPRSGGGFNRGGGFTPAPFTVPQFATPQFAAPASLPSGPVAPLPFGR